MQQIFTIRFPLLCEQGGPGRQIYRGAVKSLARPTSRCNLFDGKNISFYASLVLYIYVNVYSTNIPPIMITNSIYENQNLLSLYLISFLVGLRIYHLPGTETLTQISLFTNIHRTLIEIELQVEGGRSLTAQVNDSVGWLILLKRNNRK
jgi:hypothetical protein